MPGRAVAVGERPKDAAGLTWLLSGTLLASRDFISEEDGGPAEDPPVVVCPDVSDGDEAVWPNACDRCGWANWRNPINQIRKWGNEQNGLNKIINKIFEKLSNWK